MKVRLIYILTVCIVSQLLMIACQNDDVDSRTNKNETRTSQQESDWQPAPTILAMATHLIEQVDKKRLMQDVKWLADDARAGRAVGTAQEDEVGAWLMQRYLALKLNPFFKIGLKGYQQQFEVGLQEDKIAYGENLIGVLPGSKLAHEYVIVSAHYDHLGTDNGVVYNGADDDATGVAALLEMARIFSKQDARPARTILFIAFSGEERGQIGAGVFCATIAETISLKLFVNLNLEMFGAVHGKGTYVNIWKPKDTAASFIVDAVLAAGDGIDFPVITTIGAGPASDAKRLAKCGMAATTMDVGGGEQFYTNHPHYHSPFDDSEHIDWNGLYKATQVAAIAVWLLANDTSQ